MNLDGCHNSASRHGFKSTDYVPYTQFTKIYPLMQLYEIPTFEFHLMFFFLPHVAAAFYNWHYNSIKTLKQMRIYIFILLLFLFFKRTWCSLTPRHTLVLKCHGLPAVLFRLVGTLMRLLCQIIPTRFAPFKAHLRRGESYAVICPAPHLGTAMQLACAAELVPMLHGMKSNHKRVHKTQFKH